MVEDEIEGWGNLSFEEMLERAESSQDAKGEFIRRSVILSEFKYNALTDFASSERYSLRWITKCITKVGHQLLKSHLTDDDLAVFKLEKDIRKAEQDSEKAVVVFSSHSFFVPLDFLVFRNDRKTISFTMYDWVGSEVGKLATNLGMTGSELVELIVDEVFITSSYAVAPGVKDKCNRELELFRRWLDKKGQAVQNVYSVIQRLGMELQG